MPDNKIKYGLSNVYYAKLINTNGVITYDTPVAIPGAVSISLKPEGGPYELPADNIPDYYSTVVNNGYTGTIEFALIPKSFLTSIMGYTEDANFVLGESSVTQPNKFALIFQFEGDASARRHVLYNCLAARPSAESTTKGNSIEAKTETLELTCRPHPTTNIVKYSTGAGTPSAVYNAWFTSVYAAVNAAPALTVISLAGTTGKTKIYVAPVKGASNSLVYKTAASVALPALNVSTGL